MQIITRIPSRFFTAAALMLVLVGCATDPAVERQKAADAAERKALQSLNIYNPSQFGMKVIRKATHEAVAAEEEQMITKKNRGIGNLVLRTTNESNGILTVRYINVLDIETMHLDVTHKTPSQVKLRKGVETLPISPYVQFHLCDRGQCQAFGGGLNLLRMTSRKLDGDKVVTESTYEKFNNFSRNAFDSHVLPTKDQQVVDITVLRDSDVAALHSSYKAPVDLQICKKAKEDYNKADGGRGSNRSTETWFSYSLRNVPRDVDCN